MARELVNELGMHERVFCATKLNVAGQDGGGVDPAAAREQLETSFWRIHLPVVGLIQVHNLEDPPIQLSLLQELKEEGRDRYHRDHLH